MKFSEALVNEASPKYIMKMIDELESFDVSQSNKEIKKAVVHLVALLAKEL